MKLTRRILALLCALVLVLALCPASAAPAEPAVTVLFTHDTHDHFYPDAGNTGGYTRLATLLKEKREEYGNRGDIVLTLDAGDFSMGSLFQTVYTTSAPELVALGYMGYDVTTLGNHEFDYRPRGLVNMLSAAKNTWSEVASQFQSGAALPQIVQANYKTPKDPADADAQALVQALKDFPVTDYTVLERGGLRFAIFGVMGVDSDECAPMSGMALEPLIDAAKRVVADIKAKENPDYIICLSHSGTEDGKGEDYELAKAVDGIDLIISGHTHTTLPEPIVVNGTAVVSCGPYTQNLGVISLAGGAVKDYKLIPIDNTIAADPGLTALSDLFKQKVNEGYLSDYSLEYDEILASSSSEFTIPEMGDYIGEAYIDTVRKVEGASYDPIAFAVSPDGVIRDVVRPGSMSTSAAFDILSLGVGADGTPGYPLISLYLTGKDLKNAFEVDASVSAIMPAAALYGSGSFWRTNPNRMFFDRVAECSLANPADGLTGSIDNNRLYRVVADLYSGQMLSTVKAKSFGLLSITPRDKNGNEVTDFETLIIHDSNGAEVKAWYALASYMKSQGTILAPTPSKRITPSWNPVDLVWNAGWPTAVVALVVVLLILAVVLIVRAIVRRKKRKKGYRV